MQILEKLYVLRGELLMYSLLGYIILTNVINIVSVLGITTILSVPFIIFIKQGIITLVGIATLCLVVTYSHIKTIKGPMLTQAWVVVAGLMIVSSFIGYYNGFGSKITADIFNGLSGLTVALAMYNADIEESKLKELTKKMAVCIVLIFGASFCVLVYYQSKLDYVYPALVPNSLILAYALWKSEKKYLLCLLTIALLLISMKRSVILTGILTISIFYFIDKVGYSIKGLISSGLAASFTILIVLFSVAQVDGYKNVQVVGPSIKKINQFNPFHTSSMNMRGSSMERVKEVKAAWTGMLQYPASLIIGAGNGFIYEIEKYGKTSWRHNVHFTPMSILSRHGILVLVFFLVALFYLVHILLLDCTIADNIYNVYTMVFVLGVLGTLFSYSMATDFLTWASLGIVLRLRDNQKNQRSIEVVL